MKRVWWKEAVVYQVYPRSFNDSNGDGIGDINGVTEKLDYLKELGIDVIWLCPVYKSPNADNGYDISDYQDIMEEMGTMEDFDRLLHEVHARGMKLIIDLVINHTSDEHPWFIESRSSRDNEKRDWYIWRDKPTNWESIFGGPAWTHDEKTGQYYLHLFAQKQPDLNWENPVVRQALYQMIRWWLDKGIDGFRVDVISYIKKDFSDMPNPLNAPYVQAFEKMKNVEGIHEFLTELRDETFSKYDIMTVGEADGVFVEDAYEWISEERGKINMMFHFENWLAWDTEAETDLDVDEVKAIMTRWQKGMEGIGWNALYLENHDQPRIVSTWGNDGDYWRESATAIGCMYFLMQGTPYIYQGQEIGMTNAPFHDIELYNDVRTKTLYHYKLKEGVPHDTIMRIIKKTSRDHSRTPMQWDSSPYASFSTAEPWLSLNPNYTWLNVEAQKKDPLSILSFYRRMIALRKEWQVLVYGSYELVDTGCPTVYAYMRQDEHDKFLVVANLKEEHCIWQAQKDAVLMLGNYEMINETEIQPFEARVYRLL
ncbi:alpha-glucosidase [Planomicrobium sp. CPCC 101110]|uniref:glycoside hydrolase family 13 protein n=1 Tax=Planomicrobium sp. CPCC 101110 TaxID=2599619 RepID=UPI0011B84258|nr:alpha-glucosidase [Planomicrobium sp. CPCC 101110]TWT25087.1 alpha-glucosidase [Planomicrobium sp. CPCC 101110]